MAPKNVIVAQSGGPSPVINSSLRGVVETCRMFPDTFGTVYAGWHGIEGVLKEELLNCPSRMRRKSRCFVIRRRQARSAPAGIN